MRIIVFLLYFLTVNCIAMEASDVFSKASKSIVYIITYDAEVTPLSTGSGVVIEKNRIVTNCHVLEEAFYAQIKYENNFYNAELSNHDEDHDLCILNVNNFNAQIVSLRNSNTLKVGEKVYTIGAPFGLELNLADGLISSLRQSEDANLIITNAPISPGSSGGGLFDSNANLIGITTSYIEGGQNLNIAIPVEWIKRLAGMESEKEKLRQEEVQRHIAKLEEQKQQEEQEEQQRIAEEEAKRKAEDQRLANEEESRRLQAEQQRHTENEQLAIENEKRQYEKKEIQRQIEESKKEGIADVTNHEERKVCMEVLGVWSWKGWKDPYELIFRDGGKVDLYVGELLQKRAIPAEEYTKGCGIAGEAVNAAVAVVTGAWLLCPYGKDGLNELKWECSDPNNRKINMNFTSYEHGGYVNKDITATLSGDGQCLLVKSFDGGEGCFRRETYVPTDKPQSLSNKILGQ